MKRLATLSLLIPALGVAQTPFINLDFEAATFPQPAPDPLAGRYHSSNAMPGWTAYVGSREEPLVMRDYTTLDSPGVTVVGPGQWGPRDVKTISGAYSAGFYSGVGAQGPNSASISQTGDVPSNAETLMFKVYPVLSNWSNLVVALGGIQLETHYLMSRPHYTVLAVDVSALAGQTLELRFTAPLLGAPPYSYTGYTVDDVQFSTQTVAEAKKSSFSGYLSIVRGGLRSNELAWTNPLCSSSPLYDIVCSEGAAGPWRHYAFVSNAHSLSLPAVVSSRFYQVIWVDEAPREFEYFYFDDATQSVGIGRLNLTLPDSPHSGSWTFEGDGSPTPHPEGTGRLQASFAGEELVLLLTPGHPSPFFFRGRVTQTNSPDGCTWRRYEGDAFYVLNGKTNHAGIFSANRVP